MTDPDRQDRPVVPGAVRRRCWWRSLALQAAWNHQRMQNLGLLHVLVPWMAWRGLDAAARRRVVRRHLGYFNTNPYLAPFILGGVVRLEDEQRRGAPVSDHLIGGFRDSLSRACGAMGDELVWLGARPTTLLMACLLAWLLGWGWGLAVPVLVAAMQLGLRWRALGEGLTRGLDVIQILESRAWHRGAAWIARTALALTGLLAGLFFAGGLSSPDGPLAVVHIVALGAVALGLAVGLGQRCSGELQFLLGLAALALVSVLI